MNYTLQHITSKTWKNKEHFVGTSTPSLWRFVRLEEKGKGNKLATPSGSFHTS